MPIVATVCTSSSVKKTSSSIGSYAICSTSVKVSRGMTGNITDGSVKFGLTVTGVRIISCVPLVSLMIIRSATKMKGKKDLLRHEARK